MFVVQLKNSKILCQHFNAGCLKRVRHMKVLNPALLYFFFLVFTFIPKYFYRHARQRAKGKRYCKTKLRLKCKTENVLYNYNVSITNEQTYIRMSTTTQMCLHTVHKQ